MSRGPCFLAHHSIYLREVKLLTLLHRSRECVEAFIMDCRRPCSCLRLGGPRSGLHFPVARTGDVKGRFSLGRMKRPPWQDFAAYVPSCVLMTSFFGWHAGPCCTPVACFLHMDGLRSFHLLLHLP